MYGEALNLWETLLLSSAVMSLCTEHAMEGICVRCIHVIGILSQRRQTRMHVWLEFFTKHCRHFQAEINTKSEGKKHPFIVLGMISKELQVYDKRNNPQRVGVRNRHWELESYVPQVTRNPGKLRC